MMRRRRGAALFSEHALRVYSRKLNELLGSYLALGEVNRMAAGKKDDLMSWPPSIKRRRSCQAHCRLLFA
jgi:hypothetical protein